MKSQTIIAAALVASLVSLSSFAQGNRDDRNDRGDSHDQGRHAAPKAQHDNSGHEGKAYGARGPEWRRGGRIPNEYRGNQYVVNDWRGHHLSAPPRGEHWVQVGGDYVLVAVATGIIAQMLLSQ